MYFAFIYENRRIKAVEIVLRSGGEKRKNDRGSKSKIYCKHICKYYNVALCSTIICYKKKKERGEGVYKILSKK
jgi:hypothetical protein